MWEGRGGFGVAEVARRHGDFAIAGAVAAVQVDDAGAIARSAVDGVRGRRHARRAAPAAGAARRSAAADVDAAELAAQAVAELDDVTDDPQVPAAYRRRVGAAVVADAWRRAVGDLEGSER